MNSPALILIVDDNPTNLKLAADVLECDGYAILRAPDAVGALAILQRAMPDLILMDLQMPGMDGLALTRQLKADPLRAHILIVALTALAMKGDQERAMAAGCDGYITKPIDTRQLPRDIAALLQRPLADLAAPPPLQRKILLVEDNPTDLKLLTVVLGASGHQIYGSGSAEPAFNAIKASLPELIVLDLKLPGMDGLGLARKLKADPLTRHIPIIALTVYQDEYRRAAALAAGCDAYVLKPIDTRTFASQVARVMGEAKDAADDHLDR